ncbi:NrpR regulatory domain-containing protein, partial [Methanospirillum sp.]
MSDFLRFVSHQIEDFAMQVTFDPDQGTGTVVYNLSLVRVEDLEYAVSVFRAT